MKDRAERIRRRLVLYLDRAPDSMCLKDDVGLITRLKCHGYLQMSRQLRSKLQLGKEVPSFSGVGSYSAVLSSTPSHLSDLRR
jgi:hypothetical protein